MYFVLYDRNLHSIGKTYILESWSRVERAVDFDDAKLIGEKIPYSSEPFIVVANDKHGSMLFSGLASTPSIDEKSSKTTILLKDYATLFNTEILIDWSEFSGNTVADFISFVFDTWLSQTNVGFNNIVYDVSKLAETQLDTDISLGTEIENVSVHDLIFDAINYYNLYYRTSLDIKRKILKFQFLKAFAREQEMKLADFDISGIEKSFGEYNRVTIYDQSYNKIQQWALTEENTIEQLPSSKNLIYPAKNRNFIAEKGSDTDTVEDRQNAVYSAIYDGVMGLAQNRYQENLDLNVQKYRSVIDLTVVDFSYSIKVYSDEGFYKELPVGEIETDSSGTHIVRLGYRIQELTQEI